MGAKQYIHRSDTAFYGFDLGLYCFHSLYLSVYLGYRVYRMYSDRQALANSIDPERGVSPGATLFASQPAIFRHNIGEWIVLFQILEQIWYGFWGV